MSYVFPSVTINNMIFTALRPNQFPTITYVSGGTAGFEVVTVAPNLSNITVQIASGVSTNLQIQTAILNAKGQAVESLYAKDLVSVSIVFGHSSDTNTAVSAQTMSGASNTALAYASPSLPLTELSPDPSGVPATTPPTSTELSYLHGATSNIQAQINGMSGVTFPLMAPNGTALAPSYAFSTNDAGFFYDGSAASIGSNADLNMPAGNSLTFGAINAGDFALTTLDGSSFQVVEGGATIDFEIDKNTTAGQTKLLLWDITAATLKRVSIGAADSGGTGFKVLRVPN